MFFFVIEAFGTNAQPASGGCSTQRVWDYPNKHFAKQNEQLYIQLPCLPFRALPLHGAKNGGHAFLRILRFSGFLNALGCGFYHDKLFFIHRI